MKQSNFLLDSGPIHFRHVLRCGELEPPSHAWLSPSAFGADTLDHPDRVCTRYPKTRRFLLEGDLSHELAYRSFFAHSAVMRLDMDPAGGPGIPRRLASAAAGDHPLANYHPGLCSRLRSLWKRCNRLGLALGRPGIAARPGSA